MLKRSSDPYSTITAGKNVIQLYLGDCIKGMNEILQEKSIDIAITSPPYNIGINYNTHSDDLPREKYLEWMEQVGVAVKRVLSDDGSFFLNIGNKPSDQWIAWDVASALRKHLVLQNVMHWVKSIAISKSDAGRYPAIVGDIAVGHFKPIKSERFVNDCHEYIFHFTKKGTVKLDKLAIGVPYQDKTNIGRWKNATTDLRDRGNTWFIPYETIRSKSQRPHPATFPVKLAEMCIRLHGLRKETTVLDPFLGIGSTALASKKIGLSFVGFDIDRKYLDEATERVSRL